MSVRNRYSRKPYIVLHLYTLSLGLKHTKNDDASNQLTVSSLLFAISVRSPAGKIVRKLTEAEWRMYASVNGISIGLGKDFSPVRHQAIAWTNTDLFSIETQRSDYKNRKFNQNTTIFYQDDAFENVVCNIVALLFRFQCANVPSR